MAEVDLGDEPASVLSAEAAVSRRRRLRAVEMAPAGEREDAHEAVEAPMTPWRLRARTVEESELLSLSVSRSHYDHEGVAGKPVLCV
ncbi:hypothetical protein TRIUR3_31452 [Triticum urartu]|uniref:Uncharacterized protein n=1 Tax=Triticum urartu TaxID=4572 RepID=M7ZTT0_TRIUA|nr:hypothetical protein TRIUR3_31452 [Triticum urartu]